MTDDPTLTAKAAAQREARLAREAAALRENLKRRKAQDRARDQPAQPPAGTVAESKDRV